MQARLKELLRRAELSILAGLCLLTGLGFLTAALWIRLSLTQTPLVAASVIGVGYVVIGLVLLLIGAARRPREERRPPRPDTRPEPHHPAAILLDGFLTGIKAGRATRR